MAEYSQEKIRLLIDQCKDTSVSTTARDRALEEAFCYLLSGLPGVVYQRDTVNFFGSDEIDIAVANSPAISGLGCFPPLFLVEAKGWDDPVDSASIGAFIDKLRERHVELGILVVADRVTGTQKNLRNAYHKASSAQTSGKRLLLVTMDELLKMKTSDQFAMLLVKRLLGLAASGTFQLDRLAATRQCLKELRQCRLVAVELYDDGPAADCTCLDCGPVMLIVLLGSPVPQCPRWAHLRGSPGSKDIKSPRRGTALHQRNGSTELEGAVVGLRPCVRSIRSYAARHRADTSHPGTDRWVTANLGAIAAALNHTARSRGFAGRMVGWLRIGAGCAVGRLMRTTGMFGSGCQSRFSQARARRRRRARGLVTAPPSRR